MIVYSEITEPPTLMLLMESFETFHMQADIAFQTLFLDFRATHCTTSLCANRLDVVVAIHAYFNRCALIQSLRASHWSSDSHEFERVFFVIYIAHTASKLQLIHRLMIHGLRKSIDQPCVLHGDVKQVGE